MWRSVISGKNPFPRKTGVTKGKKLINSIRLQSSDSSSSGKGGKVVVAVVGAAVLGTGAVVYAQQNPNFRKMMKDNLPYGDTIFTYIPDWGNKSSEQKKISVPVTESAGLLKKKLEREKSEELSHPKTELPPPPISAPVPKKKEPIINQKALDEEAKKRKQKKLEEDTVSLNTALETNLNENQSVLDRLAKDAQFAQQAAVEAVKEHNRILFEALDENQDSNNDNIWNEVKLAQEAKITNLTKATEAVIDLKAAMDRLETRIHQGKENKNTANNAALLSAEEAVSSTKQQLKTVEEQLNGAQVEAQAAYLYKELIENGKKQLQKEMEAILPADAKGRALNEEEHDILLVHAHKRLLKLQRSLAKQEATEQLRVRVALEDYRKKTDSSFDEHVAQELFKQRQKIDEDLTKKESKLRDDFELEMRQQLRRQAAAHSDHIQEALAVREVELERQQSLQTQEQLLKQQSDHQEQVGHSMARLKGIQHYLQAREELERASRKAQQLWLACQALRQTVRFGKSGTDSGIPITSGDTSEASLHPLSGQVSAIREAAGDKDPLYGAVLEAIPAAALIRGVYTEEALRRRFSKVEKICKRLAMLENEDSPARITLYGYFLSYMRSLLVIDAWSSSVADSQLEAELHGRVVVEPAKWSTGDVLARVRACLERRELEQALRYASQLKGEPARAARDWLTEARLALETRQAADVLMAQAAAITVQAYH